MSQKAMLLENMEEQRPIGLSELKVSPLNTYAITDVDSLEESIRQVGLLTPLAVVGPDDDGMYEIISGARRFTAINAINDKGDREPISAVPCIILSKEIDPIIKQLTIEVSNLEARDSFDRDRHRLNVVKLYHDLFDSGVIDKKEIVSHIQNSLKVSKRYSHMYNSIFTNADQSVIDSLLSDISVADRKKMEEEDGEFEGNVHITASDASRLASLPKEEQREIIDAVNKGANVKDMINNSPNVEVKTPKSERVSLKDFGPQDYGPEEEFGNEELNNYDEDDEEFMNFLDNASMDECMEYLDNHHVDIDNDLDTTNRIKELKAMDNGKSLFETERDMVHQWFSRMAKIEKLTKLKDEDRELIEEMIELADHFNSLINKEDDD